VRVDEIESKTYKNDDVGEGDLSHLCDRTHAYFASITRRDPTTLPLERRLLII